MMDNSNSSWRRKTTLHCRMPNCPTNQLPNPKNVAVFGLPLDISMREKWIRVILAHDPNPRFNAGFKLCHLHFDPSDVVKLGNKVCANQPEMKVYDLKVDAIPKYFQPFDDPFRTKPLTLKMDAEQQPPSTFSKVNQPKAAAPQRLQLGDRIVKIIVSHSKPTPTPVRTTTMITPNKYSRPQQQQQQQQQQQPKSFCVRCINTDVEVQRLKVKMIELENKIKEQRLEIHSWKTRFNHLNKNLQSMPRTEKCSLCHAKKLTMEEFHAHLCTTANNNENATETDLHCDYCTKSFQTTIKLLNHLEVFHDDKTFVDCDRCESKFPMLKLLDIHRLTHREEEPQFACDQCDEKFYLLPRLNQHRSTKHAESEQNLTFKPFQCGSCGACFSLAKKLQAHMTMAHTKQAKTKIDKRDEDENYPFECYVCKEPMVSLAEVRMHLPEHDVTPSKKCVICREALTDDQLRFHLCRSGDKFISCEYCSQTFVSISSVMVHLENEHRDKRIHKCLDCKKYFSMKILMEYHNKLHEKIGKREHICQTCNKAFFESSHLKSHIKNAHLLERTELCEECGKAFKTIRNLEIHKLSHTEPKIQCPQCPTRFHLESALRRHQDLHRTMKYVCTICGKELKSYCGLNDHIRLHKRTDADRKHECTLCSRKFFEPNMLRKHLETVHTTIKPFKCQHCDKAYKHSGDLNKHLRTHLGDDMYACPNEKCDRRFRTPYDLQKHSSEHYVEEKEAQKQRDEQMDCTK